MLGIDILFQFSVRKHIHTHGTDIISKYSTYTIPIVTLDTHIYIYIYLHIHSIEQYTTYIGLYEVDGI